MKQKMKKAIIVGGSNGIGLAISVELAKQGYFLEICDIVSPDNILNRFSYNYNYCDLLDFNEELFDSLSQDIDVEVLMITAGIGRVADFQYHHISEIDKMEK